MSTLQAIDCSFDELSLDEARRLKSAGIELVVQCLWTGREQPAPRVINLRNAVYDGLKVAAYASLPSGAAHGIADMEAARSGVPDDLWSRLEFCAVDVERPGIRIEAVSESLSQLESLGLGNRKVVYTSWNAWRNYVIPSNDGRLSAQGNVYVWNANWDTAPDIDFPSLPFGGWTVQQVIGEQWSGGTLVEGQFADRNTFVRELVFPQVNADMCALPRLRAQSLEECNRALADGDWNRLYQWARFFGGGSK